MGNKLLWCSFGFDLLRGLANHQGFGLGEEVGGKHSVFLLAGTSAERELLRGLLLVLIVLNWIVALGSKDKIGRDELRALM